MKPSQFKAVLGFSGIPGIRHYAITGNPDGQQTITIDVTNQEVAALKGRAIEVSIAPVQTREERLREARLEALRANPLVHVTGIGAVLATIERVDDEFAKENP